MTQGIGINHQRCDYEFKISKVLSLWNKIKNRESKTDFLAFQNYVERIDDIIKSGIISEAYLYEINTPNFPGKGLLIMEKTSKKIKFYSLKPILEKIQLATSLKFS
jgi:hypothetical protein